MYEEVHDDRRVRRVPSHCGGPGSEALGQEPAVDINMEGPALATCLRQLGPTFHSFYNLPKQRRQLGTNYLDTRSCELNYNMVRLPLIPGREQT